MPPSGVTITPVIGRLVPRDIYLVFDWFIDKFGEAVSSSILSTKVTKCPHSLARLQEKIKSSA